MKTLRIDTTIDALRRAIKSQVDPSGLNLTTETKYDSRNNVVWMDDEEDIITTHTYDHRSLLTKTIYDDTGGGLQITVEQAWDDNDRLEWQEDGNDNKTTYAYDDLDRPKTITYADAETHALTYNKIHKVKTVTDPNGSVVTNTMNDLGWVTSVSISRGTGVGGTDSITNTYDGLGRITESFEKEGATQTSKVKYFFDTLGQVDKEEQFVVALSVRTIERTYDGVGFKTDLTYPDTRVIDFVPDNVYRLDQVKDGATVIADYEFWGQATVKRVFDNDTKLEVTYDAAYRPTDWDHKRLNQADPPVWVVHAGFDYSWHKDSTRKYEDRTHDSKGDAYRYDDIEELTGVKYGVTNLSSSSSYGDYTTYDSKEEPTYDDVGNRKTVGNGTTVKYNHVSDVYTADNMNEINDIDGTSRTHDDNGNLTNDGTNKFEFDYWNRLIKVTNTTPDPDEVIAEYTYDHNNRRIKKVVTNSGSLNGTALFFYDGWQVIEEQDGSGTMLQQYVYGRGIDEVLQMEKASGSTYYFHENSMGSTEMLTDTTTNDVVEEYDYKAFGDFTTPQSLSGLDNPYHWQGRRYDPETGLYYFRNRYYDADTGRFLQRDPMGVHGDPGNVGNAYVFGANGSTNVQDPLGLLGTCGGGQDGEQECPNNTITLSPDPIDMWACKSIGIIPLIQSALRPYCRKHREDNPVTAGVCTGWCEDEGAELLSVCTEVIGFDGVDVDVTPGTPAHGGRFGRSARRELYRAGTFVAAAHSRGAIVSAALPALSWSVVGVVFHTSVAVGFVVGAGIHAGAGLLAKKYEANCDNGGGGWTIKYSGKIACHCWCDNPVD
ncbi:MAG: RHS repeat-associated core domain-containing protein [Planctomycetota bacterium]|nr:RHS repeat-associated core domain-containing protein [Planctomycetota bacterium]